MYWILMSKPYRDRQELTENEIRMILETDYMKARELGKIIGRTERAVNMVRRKAQKILEGDKWQGDTGTEKIRNVLAKKFKYLK